MREWVLVPLVGGFSGFSTALIALWLRLERVAITHDQRVRSWGYWVASGFMNAFGGALVSFFLWTTYTGADFSTDAAPTGVVGASIAVGVFGVGAVQRFLYVENNLEEAANEAAGANKDLQEVATNLREAVPYAPGGLTTPNVSNALPVPIDPADASAHNAGEGDADDGQ